MRDETAARQALKETAVRGQGHETCNVLIATIRSKDDDRATIRALVEMREYA